MEVLGMITLPTPAGNNCLTMLFYLILMVVMFCLKSKIVSITVARSRWYNLIFLDRVCKRNSSKIDPK